MVVGQRSTGSKLPRIASETRSGEAGLSGAPGRTGVGGEGSPARGRLCGPRGGGRSLILRISFWYDLRKSFFERKSIQFKALNGAGRSMTTLPSSDRSRRNSGISRPFRLVGSSATTWVHSNVGHPAAKNSGDR